MPPHSSPHQSGTHGVHGTLGTETQVSHAPVVHSRRDLMRLALGALGVVYGDIGTSPLYAIKECFTLPHGVEIHLANVLGILSLVFWSLVLIVVVKYLTFVMRADNHGDGGILALLALLTEARPAPKQGEAGAKRYMTLVGLALFGAALLWADGMITPAVSVLSAIEGLEVATPVFRPLVVPLSVAILLVLFLVQKRGTGGIGNVFGPAMLIWFATIAALGVPAILRAPEVLTAVDPSHAVRFFLANRWHGFLILGSVVLCVTGSEALYADMGHFGRKPIRFAWFAAVFPALLLNYFGQGALLLRRGAEVAGNPFYGLAEELLGPMALYPLVVIATTAAVIASQALISGAFSLAQQAIQLGFSPRLTIVHTSEEASGQIYVPEVNTMMMIACIALVVGFEKSTNLAAAYGIAVMGTMAITSLLLFAVAFYRWRWPLWQAGGLTALFLAVDLPFLAANLNKLLHGGWVPLLVSAVIFTVLITWKRGRRELSAQLEKTSFPVDLFLADLEHRKPVRVPGTAVFMTSTAGGTPPVLLHHFKHNKVLHEQVILLTIRTEGVPTVPRRQRVEVEPLAHGFWRVTGHVGFMESPDVPKLLRQCERRGLAVPMNDTSYFLGRETLIQTGHSKMARWRKSLFSFLTRNARPATAFFRLPPNRVVELGAQVEI